MTVRKQNHLLFLKKQIKRAAALRNNHQQQAGVLLYFSQPAINTSTTINTASQAEEEFRQSLNSEAEEAVPQQSGGDGLRSRRGDQGRRQENYLRGADQRRKLTNVKSSQKSGKK